MSSSYRTIKRSFGFSVIELMVAIGLLGFLSVSAFALFQYFYSRSMLVQNEVSARLDEAVAERLLFEDLAASTPALGAVTWSDDNNLEFFDLYDGLSHSKIADTEKSRTITLDAAKGGGAIELIVGASIGAGARYFPIAKSYDAVEDLFNPGPLTYAGINRNGFFGDNFPKQWKEGQYFLFFSPTMVRRADASLISPARPYSFLGYVKDGDIAMDVLDGHWKVDHPLYKDVTIHNIDEYFRWLPSIGGSMAAVLVVPVKVIRYRLVPDERNPVKGKLWRSTRDGQVYKDEILYGQDLAKISFKRPDVTTRLIEFKLELKP